MPQNQIIESSKLSNFAEDQNDSEITNSEIPNPALEPGLDED